jgi:hypothetical protein
MKKRTPSWDLRVETRLILVLFTSMKHVINVTIEVIECRVINSGTVTDLSMNIYFFRAIDHSLDVNFKMQTMLLDLFPSNTMHTNETMGNMTKDIHCRANISHCQYLQFYYDL